MTPAGRADRNIRAPGRRNNYECLMDQQILSGMNDVGAVSISGTASQQRLDVGGDEEAPPLTAQTTAISSASERKAMVSQFLRPAGIIWWAGIPCCVLSAFFFSVNAILVKCVRELSIFEVAFVRSLLAISITSGLMYVNGLHSLYADPRNLPLLMGRGLMGSTAVLLSYVGIQNIPLADAQTIFFLYPAATALMAFFLLRERLGLIQVVGVVASVAGVVIIAQPPMLFGDSFAWEVGRGFTMTCLVAAALMSATSITIIRKLGNAENSIVTAMWFHLTALSVSVPALAVGWPKFPQWNLNSFECACLLGIGLTGFAAQLLFNRGIQLTSGATAACISSLQVLLAYLWGIVIFREMPTMLGTAGSVVVVCGLIAVNMGSTCAVSSPGPANCPVEQVKQATAFGANKEANVKLATADVRSGDDANFITSYATHAVVDEETSRQAC